MKKTGAQLVRFALEQIGVRHTFGIPGVHNTELYDQLNLSPTITPHLVTHEESASFAADAISRSSNSIGTLLVVPAAGLTHAASGIAEASLDGIAMLVISGGVRTDTGAHYQLHDMDQHSLMAPITKGCFKPTDYSSIIPTIYQAYELAISGEPGPVYVEVPVNLQLLTGEVEHMPSYQPAVATAEVDQASIEQAAQLLLSANQVGLFVGWGATKASKHVIELAELLAAPVSTTLQGLGVIDARHPLHTGMSFGESAVPAAQKAFSKVDCLFAIATRFSEIPTGSFGLTVPDNLIHLDINPNVFNKNYPAVHTLEGDAERLLPKLIEAIKAQRRQAKPFQAMAQTIAQDKADYVNQWLAHDSGKRVNPMNFFQSLRQQLADDAMVICDDGNHTFLTAELLPIHCNGGFISPTDFNAMGYCIPATIGAKLASPERQVIGIVGDGAAAMTGLEALTASHNQLGITWFIFNDGELSQISQAQQVPYNRKTCTVLPTMDWKGVAMATQCEYLLLDDAQRADEVIAKAFQFNQSGKPVYVDVRIDYSKSTRFTQGAVKTNFNRFDLGTKVRFLSRAVWRRIKTD
ncbi:thiamine pyrophosphate-binding protein [Paraferrimonas haliotis]|uniref:Acetolactate synthase, large subunit, biosynthetic type n=1 Tax=Paraferrimonas haliotis TaxID=2013866 RepID=A0AA37TM47_9GAMM|nr:thiamine pyrophosphate-binding protein [Paraferrimonas haliotis]GLS82043.1 acetolactate synthase, large subunit, biosynthetic type [Paraferrimonas haliotis]